MLSRENAEYEVIRHFEKTEEKRKIVANLAKGMTARREGGYKLFRSRRDWTMDRRRRKLMESDERLKQRERECTRREKHVKRALFTEESAEEAQEARMAGEIFENARKARRRVERTGEEKE